MILNCGRCSRTWRAAADGAGSGWWHAFRGLIPPEYRDFISLEANACAARTLETSVVPGLLQTPDYARAVTRAALEELPVESVNSLVEVRIARQSVLRAERPLELSAVLDEAALRREVGGCRVMREQLRQLAETAQLPHVRLQLLPFSVGGYVGLTGPFVIFSFIFSFPNIFDLGVVVRDHLTSSLYLERKEDLEVYSAAFHTMQKRALSPADSFDSSQGSVTAHRRHPPHVRSPRTGLTTVAAQQPQHGNEQLRRGGPAARRNARGKGLEEHRAAVPAFLAAGLVPLFDRGPRQDRQLTVG
ncbi:hypothetical protein QFZ67_006755 [Streptomyces sp. V1I1]|nr:hypothetical protein [Streptomyces sp. V1I1]